MMINKSRVPDEHAVVTRQPGHVRRTPTDPGAEPRQAGSGPVDPDVDVATNDKEPAGAPTDPKSPEPDVAPAAPGKNRKR